MRRAVWIYAGAAILGAAALLSMVGVVQSTQSVEFCTSCHVMSGVAEEWRKSPHGLNASGVVATCADCHVNPGALPLIRSKLASLRDELAPWILGARSPEHIETHRAELAQGVWEHLRASDSAPCRSCHVLSVAVLELQTTRARTQHRDAVSEGKTCIDCHDDGVAHRAVERPAEEKPWEPDAESQDFSL